MYRLLLVDDERHVVDWLYELFIEKLGLEQDIFKAYSGKEALKILETNRIDIVLSDIRMPGMNGLELLNNIKSFWPGCRVIFLTGFNEFDYIYEAVKHEGVSYLLKTEDDDKIVQEVKNAVESLEADLKNRELMDRAIEVEQIISHLIQKEILLDIIYKRVKNPDIDVDMIRKLEINLDIRKPVILLLGRLHGNPHDEDNMSQWKSVIFLKYLTGKYMSIGLESSLIDIDKSNVLWILQPQKGILDASEPEVTEKCLKRSVLHIREMLETLQGACRESIRIEISFLLYDRYVSWESIGEEIDALKFIANSRHGNSSGIAAIGVINNTDELFASAEKKPFLAGHLHWQKVEMLKRYLENCMEKEFVDLLYEMTQSIENILSKHYFPAIEVYYSISLVFLTYINQCSLVEKLSFRISLNQLGYIEGFDSWKEAAEYLCELGRLIFEIKEDEQADRNNEIIERIKTFVGENINSELSLVRISESVNYNPSYVSRLFKKVEGSNLFDYINEIRINKAKELLKNNFDTVQNVAKAVGYESSQYFATSFKKMTGMTPNEYRINHTK